MNPPAKRTKPSGPSGPKRTRFASPPPSSSSGGPSSSRGGALSSHRNEESTGDNDENDLDDLLEEDLPEAGTAAKSRSKKQIRGQTGKNGDGSDSSEGEDEADGLSWRKEAADKGKDGQGKDADGDDDMDMFADEAEEPKKEEAKGKGKGKSKDKEFLDMDDIEGQEFDKKRGGMTDDDEESGSDGDPVDVDGTGLDANGDPIDVRIGRKKAKEKDLGFEVTPFNMKAEMDEGRFTANGEEYVANERDPNDKHDVWLVDFDKDEIKKARKAHKEREKAEAEREKMEDEGVGKERQGELLSAAVGLMERGETVLEALQRIGVEVEEKRRKEEAGASLNAQGKKKSWAERQKERKAAMAQDELSKDSITTTNPFTNLTNIVSGLTAIGQLDVYSLSREAIQRMLPAPAPSQPSSSMSSSRPPGPDTRQFQYRFSMGYIRKLPEGQRPVEREIFGPFSAIQLQQWRGTGFFGSPACENVELRLAGDDSAQWGSWADVVA